MSEPIKIRYTGPDFNIWAGEIKDYMETGGGTPFQVQDRSSFSPLPSNVFSIEGLFMVMLLKTIMSNPKMFERLAVKYLDSCARIVESVEDGCHSNWLTALNNQHIAAAISHRLGLIDNGSYVNIMQHYRSVFDKLLIKGYTVEGLHTLVQGAKVAGSTLTGLAGAEADSLAALAKIRASQKTP